MTQVVVWLEVWYAWGRGNWGVVRLISRHLEASELGCHSPTSARKGRPAYSPWGSWLYQAMARAGLDSRGLLVPVRCSEDMINRCGLGPRHGNVW